MALSIVREITLKTPPPRALFLRRPFGHALGQAGAREEQLATLAEALRLMVEAREPGTLRDAPFRWRRDVFAEPDWEALKRLGA